MKIKNDLGPSFNQDIPVLLNLIESLVRSILLYKPVTFRGCLKLPQNNPFENPHMIIRISRFVDTRTSVPDSQQNLVIFVSGRVQFSGSREQILSIFLVDCRYTNLKPFVGRGSNLPPLKQKMFLGRNMFPRYLLRFSY